MARSMSSTSTTCGVTIVVFIVSLAIIFACLFNAVFPTEGNVDRRERIISTAKPKSMILNVITTQMPIQKLTTMQMPIQKLKSQTKDSQWINIFEYLKEKKKEKLEFRKKTLHSQMKRIVNKIHKRSVSPLKTLGSLKNALDVTKSQLKKTLGRLNKAQDVAKSVTKTRNV